MNEISSSNLGNTVPQGWQPISNDTVELRKMVLVFWRQRVTILCCTVVFFCLGLSYALLSPQIWVSQAEIKPPTLKEVESLEFNVNQLINAQVSEGAFSGFGKKNIYDDFINSFNGFDNKKSFLIENGYLDIEALRIGAENNNAKRLLLNDMADGINARVLDKSSDNITLYFSAGTAKDAKSRLEEYIDYIQKKEIVTKSKELSTIWKNRIKTLESQYKSAREDTLKQLQDDILRTDYSLRISQAAGIETPVQNLQNKGSFTIDLGARALAEQLKVLKEIKNPEFMNPALGDLRLQLSSLQALKVETLPFQSFAYLASPSEPLSRDKPKRPLIVVLATLLGGMLGVGIVLVRHAFRRPEHVGSQQV
ncbi:LPS O-antigen chain length determinant protein WzzB [Aeromonas intestinalis]